ncbi:MAG TPA: PadR family transcriptional regulator [Candidatus Saccharimonadales bacterium]
MSVVRLLVLGAIKRRKLAHGYRIYRDLTDWRVETWTVVRPGSIYHAISQLESQGLIRATENSNDQKLGPAKTEYKLTAQGEQEFEDLLEQALKNVNLEGLSAGIAFMEYLPRQKVVELLQERAKAQHNLESFLRKLPTEEVPTVPSKHPEVIRVWAESYTYAAKSTETLITSIKSGKYVFKNEEVKR